MSEAQVGLLMLGRWRLRRVQLSIGVVLVLVGLALAAFDRTRDFGSPVAAVRQWQQAARRGDVLLMESSERLGSREFAQALIRDLGQADYLRVMGIYGRAAEFGATEATRITNAIQQGGEAAFGALPWGEQQDITSRSRREWALQRGFDSARDHIASWEQIVPVAPSAELVRQLGTARLLPADQTILGNRATADPAVQGDPDLLVIAQRRDALGQAEYSTIRARAERNGDTAFRRLPWDERTRIDGDSRRRDVQTRGLAALSTEDRGRVPGPEVLIPGPAADEWRQRLGLAGLQPIERAEIEGQTQAAFEAQHDAYVRTTGIRLARAFLTTSFQSADFDVRQQRRLGSSSRDLIQREHASVDVDWTSLGWGLLRKPNRFLLAWATHEREWRIARVEWVETRAEAVRSISVEGESHDVEWVVRDGGSR